MAALSSATPSRPRRRLALLALVPGALATAFVVVTLVLIAMKGHPEGLLAIIAGVAVPVVLRGGGRLARLARTRLRSARDAPPSSQAELEIELRSTSVRWPPTGKTITFPWAG
jgi:hypothetical protein